jgi:hypothetical protein
MTDNLKNTPCWERWLRWTPSGPCVAQARVGDESAKNPPAELKGPFLALLAPCHPYPRFSSAGTRCAKIVQAIPPGEDPALETPISEAQAG